MFDVAVVGSGPAGACAALSLARHGLRVAIVEKEPLPRYKTCGGGLVGRGLRLLPPDVDRVVERRCDSAELHLHDAGLHFTATRRSPVIAMTMRDQLDYLLTWCAAAAGAEVISPCRVTGVAVEDHRARLDTTRGPLTAAFVIAADGATSDVARQSGWQDGRHLIPALEYEVEVDDGAFGRFASVPRFDVGVVPYGYAWVFPKATHLSVGVLSTRRGPLNLHRYLEQYLRTLGLRTQSVQRHGFLIPVRPRGGPLVRNRVMLVGDAAGLADPVTGEGISLAAQSGQLAAEAVVRSGFDERGIRETYHTALRRSMLPELKLGRALARLVYDHPRLRNWLFRRYGQRFVEALTDAFMGERTYRASLVGTLGALPLRHREDWTRTRSV